MEIVTYEALYEVLKELPLTRGMKDEDIKNLAHYIVNFFGYSDRIVDNILTPEDRHVFIMLEEFGILGTYEEELTVLRGKLWRVHYWVYRKDMIEKILKEGYHEKKEKKEKNVYDEIFKEV